MANEPGKVNLIELNVEAFADQARRAEIQSKVEAALGGNYQIGELVTRRPMFAVMEIGSDRAQSVRRAGALHGRLHHLQHLPHGGDRAPP